MTSRSCANELGRHLSTVTKVTFREPGSPSKIGFVWGDACAESAANTSLLTSLDAGKRWLAETFSAHMCSKRKRYNPGVSLDNLRETPVSSIESERQGGGLRVWNLSSSMCRAFLLGVVLLCLGPSRAYGDVGVVLNESLDTSIARITGSGHTAVYLSRICPESPVRLRFCRADEQGSVISNYTTLGEDQPFEWNAVPLSVYLYGVEDPQYRPMIGSQKIKHVLEERYREKFLPGYCESESCKTSNKAEWREMVGATLSRSMYMFVAETTVEQDLDLIAQFNARPNQNHFNGVTRNCADFARRVINTYFPHAAGPDYINDFGMTSPKAVARSFTRYSLRHPETHFRVVHYA